LAGGDWLHETRIRNKDRLAGRTEELLRGRGTKPEECEPSPSVIIPLLLTGQDETREELQELFARLIANALDSDRSFSVRRDFIDIVKQFEPVDARLLMEMSKSIGAGDWRNSIQAKIPIEEIPLTDRNEIKLLIDPIKLTDGNSDALELGITNLEKFKIVDMKTKEAGKDGFLSIVRSAVSSFDQRHGTHELSDMPEVVYLFEFTAFGRELLRALKT